MAEELEGKVVDIRDKKIIIASPSSAKKPSPSAANPSPTPTRASERKGSHLVFQQFAS
jgi:hypothetical protein